MPIPWLVLLHYMGFWESFCDIRILGILSLVCKDTCDISMNELAWKIVCEKSPRLSKDLIQPIFLLSAEQIRDIPYLFRPLGIHSAHLIRPIDAYHSMMTKFQNLQVVSLHRKSRKYKTFWKRKTYIPNLAQYVQDFIVNKNDKALTKKIAYQIFRQSQNRKLLGHPELNESEKQEIGLWVFIKQKKKQKSFGN